VTPHNLRYLMTKRDRLGHQIHLGAPAPVEAPAPIEAAARESA
jgi:hypothetical protein